VATCVVGGRDSLNGLGHALVGALPGLEEVGSQRIQLPRDRVVVLVTVQAEDRGIDFVPGVGRGFTVNRVREPENHLRGGDDRLSVECKVRESRRIRRRVPNVPCDDFIAREISNPGCFDTVPNGNREFGELIGDVAKIASLRPATAQPFIYCTAKGLVSDRSFGSD